ncbi:hypothetical protein [Streptomyces sp. H51]|uniref:hypothetical protein n=1 Tax=Streptomyces sp. H51 TaxID=3111770 RepID=UPI002D793E12|nr:hypothetical protein [Streptomyces sp. H51]
MAGMQELRAWAAKWLGDREVPQEFLQLAAIQEARSSGGPARAALEAARPSAAGAEDAEALERMRDASDPLDYLGIEILGPQSAQGNGLARHVLDEQANATVPHLATLLGHFLPAAEKEEGCFVHGYWLYPGEVWPPPVVCIDDEATFCTARGRTLTEALLADHAEDDSEVALLGRWFTDLGVPVGVRTDAEIPDSPVRTDPRVLEQEL